MIYLVQNPVLGLERRKNVLPRLFRNQGLPSQKNIMKWVRWLREKEKENRGKKHSTCYSVSHF